MEVILLNQDYTFLNKVSIERAFALYSKGKVTVEKYSDKVIRTVTDKFVVPLIMRLNYLVRSVFKKGVLWSKKNVMIRDRYKCVYCNAKKGEIKYTKTDDPYKVIINIDHVIPQSRGGKNTFENTVTSCFDCNNKKGDYLLSEIGMYFKNRYFKPRQPTINEFMLELEKSLGLDIFKMLKEL